MQPRTTQYLKDKEGGSFPKTARKYTSSKILQQCIDFL